VDDEHDDGGVPGFSEGVLTDPAILDAATGTLLGISPRHYLSCEDPFEQEILRRVIEQADRQRFRLIDHLGVTIAKAVWGGG
jgi:hypothetical protein